MRYSTVIKFAAFVLCAATLLGAVACGAGIVAVTELGGKTAEEQYSQKLHNRASGYARMAGQVYASEQLGQMPRSMINEYFGNDWESWYFDWSKVGYTLYDPQGNMVKQEELPDRSRGVSDEVTVAVIGQYMKMISTEPYEKPTPEPGEPVGQNVQVVIMPGQGKTQIGTVILDYTDGRQQQWHTGEVLGELYVYTIGGVEFESRKIGEIPMGDGWYVNHILMADMGGNIVYEACSDSMVISGMELDGNLLRLTLPEGSVTAAAPAGTTYTDGSYTEYSAIPSQGVTVAGMNVLYANARGETLGSEGISSPDLIGTLFHNHQGNAEFHSSEPMSLDIPAGGIITGISFTDTQQNLIFEARCPDGVGTIAYDHNRYLTFNSQRPGTEIPQQIIEETTEQLPQGRFEGITGIVTEPARVYNMPGTHNQVVGTLAPGQQVLVVVQQAFPNEEEGQVWCMIETGWVPMEYIVLLKETPETEAEPRNMMAEVPDMALQAQTTQPPEVMEPQIPVAMEESEEIAAQPSTAVEEATVPEAAASYSGDTETGIYYDSAAKQDMVASYIWEPIPDGYTMTVQLAPGALRDELGWMLMRLAEMFRGILLKGLGICLAVFALCVVHLVCSAGRTRRTNAVRAGGLNRIPLDLYLAGGSALAVGLVFGAVEGSLYFVRNDEQLAVAFLGACCYLLCLLLVGFFFAFVAQIKTPGGYWWRNSLCGRCILLTAALIRKVWGTGRGAFLPWLGRVLKALANFAGYAAAWLWDTARRLGIWLGMMAGKSLGWTTAKFARFFGRLPITWQFLTTGFSLVFLLYMMIRTYKVGYILLGFGMFFAVILYAATAFAILLESAKRMSKGDLDTKVDDRMLIGGFREFAGELNDLADVAVVAAQKQLRSERMKTELITNVSHDIKTPLTSIINYVDLLQKPHTAQEQEQYLEVLDRQSQRLKKLIDDLMEMSKASTGNMTVDIQRVDATEAVNQALGEFADKLERAQLVPVFHQPEDQVIMLADGRLVWRVMSNLLGNAVKYALPGTRIYLDLQQEDGKVIISMKNISREELNVNADELMERFVRGDASRNTEGSGLGLNIARSLMELQKGQLQILVDGDLFKVTLIFPGI